MISRGSLDFSLFSTSEPTLLPPIGCHDYSSILPHIQYSLHVDRLPRFCIQYIASICIQLRPSKYELSGTVFFNPRINDLPASDRHFRAVEVVTYRIPRPLCTGELVRMFTRVVGRRSLMPHLDIPSALADMLLHLSSGQFWVNIGMSVRTHFIDDVMVLAEPCVHVQFQDLRSRRHTRFSLGHSLRHERLDQLIEGCLVVLISIGEFSPIFCAIERKTCSRTVEFRLHSLMEILVKCAEYSVPPVVAFALPTDEVVDLCVCEPSETELFREGLTVFKFLLGGRVVSTVPGSLVPLGRCLRIFGTGPWCFVPCLSSSGTRRSV